MIDYFVRMAVALWSNELSQLFSIIIILYFVLGLIFANTKNERGRVLVSNAAGAMTSLGILGTFTGIFIGLLDFDIRTINRSVPDLLEGLKVAFGTSILGLTGAVLFRIISPFIRKTRPDESGTSAGDILEGIEELDRSVNAGADRMAENLDGLMKALTDDRDSSIVGQLQRLRTNVVDLEKSTSQGFKDQIKEFRDFAEHMSESFSKAIIEELQSVIREFNEKISEQFGENFKQLNAAVGLLVEWQDEYRQQMSDLKMALDNAVEGIGAAERSLSQIQDAASSIPDHMGRLNDANVIMNENLSRLWESLGGFAEMRDKAVNAIPEIRQNIEEITINMRSTVEEQSRVVQEISHTSRDIVETQKESAGQLLGGFGELKESTAMTSEQLQEDIASITEKLSDDLDSAGDALFTQIEKVSAAMEKSISESASQITEHLQASVSDQRKMQIELLDGLQNSFNETVANTTSRMNAAIGQLDEAIQNEIQSVVRTMAENLSGVTEKFVADYTPLLQTTRQIVEMGERASRE